MQQISKNINDINELSAILGATEIRKPAAAARSMLVHIYTAFTDEVWLQVIGEKIQLSYPNAHIIGATTCGEILNGQTVLEHTVINFSFFQSTQIHPFVMPITAGEELDIGQHLRRCVDDLGEAVPAIMLLTTPLTTNANAVASGLMTTSPSFQVFGGGAGDYALKTNYIMYGSTVYTAAAMVIAFQGADLQIEKASFLGWRTMSQEMTISQASGTTLHTIDGRPAFEIYQHYFNIKNDAQFFNNALGFPLLIKRNGQLIALVPVAVGLNNSLEFISDVYVGEKLSIGFMDTELIQKNLAEVQRKMLAFQPESLLIYSCGCRRWALCQDIKPETNVFEKIAPTAGFYTVGEFCNQETVLPQLNLAFVIVGMREGAAIAPLKPMPTQATISNSPIADIYKGSHLNLITKLSHFNKVLNHELLIAKKQAEGQTKILSMALEQSHSAVMITDLDTHIEYVNQAFVNTTGYAREEIIGSKSNRFKSGKTPNTTYESMWASLNTGDEWHGEIINQNKNGDEFIEQTWISPIREEDGTISHYLSVKEDITEDKKNAALLVAAKDRAETLTKHKSQFLANMSHEIRTPMMAIMGFSDLALLDEVPPETYGYLQDINAASNHLLAILNDILDVSKLDAEKMTLQLECFNLADMRSMLHGLFINTAQDKGLSLIIALETQVPTMLIGDSLRLRQVLINLLSNALKFTQQGSVNLTISLLELTKSEARLLFAVTDTGMGISAEQQAKLFQPFSQVNDSYIKNLEGTGLGLTISQNLVELMGDRIKLDSQVGSGSCFSFELTLPLALVPIKPKTKPTIRPNMEVLSNIQILLVEDNPFNQKVVTRTLNLFGASIVLANNGLEALTVLEQQEFDIVLMDLHMPSMDGFETTVEIRKQPRYAQLPVIAFSAGVTEQQVKQRCLAVGMNDVVSKPIDNTELLTILARWVKRQH
jgi:PAS domain S-box-containing protein